MRTYLDDYDIGEKWTTPGRTITEANIVNYAGLTGDWHPIHTDSEYAEKSPFGQRIAHGMLTLCIGSTLPFRITDDNPTPKKFLAFYGLDKVRFMSQVKIGDTLHSEIEIVSIEFKDNKTGVLASITSVKNHHGETVCVFSGKILVERRPAE